MWVKFTGGVILPMMDAWKTLGLKHREGLGLFNGCSVRLVGIVACFGISPQRKVTKMMTKRVTIHVCNLTVF